MRKLTYFSLLAYAFICLAASCSKKLDSSETFLKGLIDGQPFECSNIQANKPEPIPNSLGSDPTLRITGAWPSYSLKLMILYEREIKAGTYTFRSDKDWSATLWKNNIDFYYAGNAGILAPPQLYGNGSITIKEISRKHVKGSFEFTAVLHNNTEKRVTNGQFAINRN